MSLLIKLNEWIPFLDFYWPVLECFVCLVFDSFDLGCYDSSRSWTRFLFPIVSVNEKHTPSI